MFEKPTQQIHFRIRNNSLILRLFFSHTEGKFSLVNCLRISFSFYCSLKVGDTTSCTYYATSYKAWKLQKSSAHCRDHPFQSFRTPKNKDSRNLKPLSTPQRPYYISSTFKLRNFTLPVGKLRNTHSQFTEVVAFFCWSILWLCLA